MNNDQGEIDTPFGVTEALKLVSPFFDQEWLTTNTKDVQLRQITGGLINRLHLLQRFNIASKEPAAILIRHFGASGDRNQQPLNSSTTLSTAEQAIAYFETGRRGWGPKLYGTFPGGRLEEWIDAHPLTAAESMHDLIRTDIARSFARLHSLQLPFRRDSFDLVVREMVQGFRSNGSEVMKFLGTLEYAQASECATIFGTRDWSRELAWTSRLFKEFECKATLATGDTNYLNILVKNYKSECAVMLIDYETLTYSYRGIDIGGHFMERMYSWSQPASKLTGCSAPDLDEQRAFCRAYLQEIQGLGRPLTRKDTVEQLLLESRIGAMHQLLIVVLMCLILDEIESDPYFLEGLTHMMKTYLLLKDNFMQDHRISADSCLPEHKSTDEYGDKN